MTSTRWCGSIPQAGECARGVEYLIMMEIACALIMFGAAALATGEQTVNGEVLAKYDFYALRAGLPSILQHGGAP